MQAFTNAEDDRHRDQAEKNTAINRAIYPSKQKSVEPDNDIAT